MTRRRRRTVFAFDRLEGRLSLDGTGAAVVVAPDMTSYMVSDLAVSADTSATGDSGSTDPGTGLTDPTDPGSNDGQLPFLPLDPAPLNPDGPA